MGTFAAMRKKRWAVLTLRSSLLAIFFTLLFWKLQPFSPRAKGMTQREWFSEWTRLPVYDREVIDTFGTNAVAPLLRSAAGVHRAAAIVRALPISPLRADQIWTGLNLHRRAQVATDWLTILHHRGHDLTPALLAAGETNILLSIYCFCTPEQLDQILADRTQPQITHAATQAKALIARWGWNGGIERLIPPPPEPSERQKRRAKTNAPAAPRQPRRNFGEY